MNRINADVADWGTIRKIYFDLFPEVQTVMGTTRGSEVFFRSRINPPTKPQSVSELMAPPAAAVQGYQRCNPPGVPMFYCSSRRVTALKECRVNPGDTAYLSQWMGLEQLPINKFLDPGAAHFYEGLSPPEMLLYGHLDTVFTRRVHHTFSNDYKFSAAATDQLTTNYPEKFRQVAADGKVGLLYPSIFDAEGSFNFAFPPAWAQERMKLLHLMELRIDSVEDDAIEVTLLDTAANFPEGQIEWSGNMRNLPLLRETSSSVLFRCDGENWNLATLEHAGKPDISPETYVNLLIAEAPKEQKMTRGFPNLGALTGSTGTQLFKVAAGLPYDISMAIRAALKS